MVFDWKRLEGVAASTELSPVELWLIDNARASGERARITILRAVNSDGERVWFFDPAFDNAALQEAGYVLTKALLPFHRALRKAGVMLMVHSDWGDRESYGMRNGIWRCLEEFRARAKAETDTPLENDQWVLKHMVQHMSLSLEHIVEKILPDHLTMIDRRWEREREREP
jgi:hypothetical protein